MAPSCAGATQPEFVVEIEIVEDAHQYVVVELVYVNYLWPPSWLAGMNLSSLLLWFHFCVACAGSFKNSLVAVVFPFWCDGIEFCFDAMR